MDYLKKSINEDNFKIEEFFRESTVANKYDGDILFKALIEKLVNFRNTSKNKSLISFAQATKQANFSVLESKDAYDYWCKTIDERNTLKRVFNHVTKEEEITNAILELTKKRQKIANKTSSKKSVSSLSSDTSQSESKILTTVWSVWSQFLHLFLTGDENDTKDIHQYSLEYMGIIMLGDKIGNKQTRVSYPKDLVDMSNELLGLTKHDVFAKFRSLYDNFFLALTISDDKCHEVLLKNSLRIKNTNDSSLSFCYEFFIIFVTQVFKKSRISKFESEYNFRVVWKFLDTVATALPTCYFVPGEVRLKAINQEVKRQGLSAMNFYNADGIITEEEFDVELVLLETSGPFGNKDKNRETKDHIKAAYGLLAMLHTVAYKFLYADINLFKQLKICFIHAANKKIRLWTFALVTQELYVLNRISSSILPTDPSDSQDDLMNMTNMMWDLKRFVEESTETLKKIKESHEKNKLIVQKGSADSQLKQLDSFLVDIAEVKLSSRVVEADDIYVSSSPIQSDIQNF